ncbi:HAMP domain-containing protein [bacterium]|jgi:signal transduction histidine kinase|nr:HAMP domain-containing protein [bacterium]
MSNKKLIWQLYPSYLLVIVVTVVLMLIYASSTLKSFYINQTASELKIRTTLMEKQSVSYLSDKNYTELNDVLLKNGQEINTRFTIVDINGVVLADSDEDPENMDNHSKRPEIVQAFSGKWGVTSRYSQTLETTMLYIAKPIKVNGEIIALIRSSIPIKSLDIVLVKLKKRMIGWGVIISIFSAMIGYLVSKRISTPIKALTDGTDEFSKGNFDYQLEVPETEEFKKLADALNNMAIQLNNRMTTIMDSSKEKEATLSNIKKLEEMRKNFVSNVSHELKTPITLIKGFLETLMAGAVDNKLEREEFLNIIQVHTHRLDIIIDDLLSLSRIEQENDHNGIEKSSERINDVIKKAIDTCTPKANKTGIAITFESKEDIYAEINVSLIEQALINLIDNAIKYSPSKESIRLNLKQTKQETVVTVTDNGCGIPAKHLSHLFERFYRVDKARSRELGGTGLGLAIVKHICQAHGGFINVESKEGEGSSFSISLPVG